MSFICPTGWNRKAIHTTAALVREHALVSHIERFESTELRSTAREIALDTIDNSHLPDNQYSNRNGAWNR